MDITWLFFFFFFLSIAADLSLKTIVQGLYDSTRDIHNSHIPLEDKREENGGKKKAAS